MIIRASRAAYLFLAGVCLLTVLRSPALSQDQQAAPPAAPGQQAQKLGLFAVPDTNVTMLTGDTWQQDGWTVRLYGVQSCLRGTFYTNPAGIKQDCGEASLYVLAALLKDIRPQCRPLSVGSPDATSQKGTLLAVCVGIIGQEQLDLGTALILKGYAFASRTPQGEAVFQPYAAAEDTARNNRAGLWAAADLPYPNLTDSFRQK